MKTQAHNQCDEIKFRNETKRFFNRLTQDEKVANQPKISEVINFFHLVITRKLRYRPNTRTRCKTN